MRSVERSTPFTLHIFNFFYCLRMRSSYKTVVQLQVKRTFASLWLCAREKVFFHDRSHCRRAGRSSVILALLASHGCIVCTVNNTGMGIPPMDWRSCGLHHFRFDFGGCCTRSSPQIRHRKKAQSALSSVSDSSSRCSDEDDKQGEAKGRRVRFKECRWS